MQHDVANLTIDTLLSSSTSSLVILVTGKLRVTDAIFLTTVGFELPVSLLAFPAVCRALHFSI